MDKPMVVTMADTTTTMSVIRPVAAISKAFKMLRETAVIRLAMALMRVLSLPPC